MIVALFGPPGSGKGTQAAMLAERLSYFHISTGNLLREAVEKKSVLGLQVREVLASGALVSDALVCDILADALDGTKGSLVIDGFPRTLLQIEMLDNILKARNLRLERVIFLQVSDSLIEERLTGRFACTSCAAGYHKLYKPTQKAGICDRCGAVEFIYREDDRPEVVRRRLQVYRAETEPVLDVYRRRSLVCDVFAEDEPELVFSRICDKIGVETPVG